MNKPKQFLKNAAKSVLAGTTQLRDRIRWGHPYGQTNSNFDRGEHLQEAMDWLKRAQDSGTDRGVSYGVTLGDDFMESYPETTGYIIPTFLEWASFYEEEECLSRAIEMGEWEIAIQMDSGAVMGGKYSTNPTPAVFNTGQVLLGWASLYQATIEKRFLDAARRASAWLVEIQEPDGNWTKGHSQFALAGGSAYNVKAAWGLLSAAKLGGWDDFALAAERNADFCLTRQQRNGWFADCCLTDPTQPLLHTIAYTMQGLVGIGRLADRPRYIEAAAITARALIDVMDESGFIPARLNSNFQGTVKYCCLTGSAQTSIVWSMLYELTGDKAYRKARESVNRYLMSRHNITGNDPVLRGGVFGSWPFWGEYGKNTVLNWATKFFIDALLLEEKAG